jgi:inward rectifier potassium channel
VPKSPRPADRDDARAPAEPPAMAAPAIRMIQPSGRLNVVRLGQRHQWSDLYHGLLTIGWPLFLCSMAIAYLGANLIFALLYLGGEDAIANARPGSFADAFFFSVQTMATIGYGVMYPQTVYANILMTLETLLGMIAVAIGAGIVFARVSRPTARVLFSRIAVIVPYDGPPTLMIRAANQRLNQILQAEVQLTLARNEITAEGQYMRRFHDLELARSRSPLFALTWTIMHPIGPGSPLHGATSETLRSAEIEIIVTLSGIDETFSQTVHARHSYAAEDIIWDKRFADVLSILPGGRRAVDFRRFDEIAPL